MKQKHYFIDLLHSAQKLAPNGDHVAIQPMTLARDARMGLFQHPTSKIVFEPIQLGSKPRLSFACGLKQFAWNRAKTQILFEIFVRDNSGSEHRIFSFKLDPKDHQHRKWLEQDVDLAAFSGKSATFIFSTSVPPKAPTDYCWSGWADPFVAHEVPERPRRKFAEKRPHVFLISADALRADLLGCYGNTEITTPNIDRLANDGILLKHSRSQTSLTLGSYASLLTGLHLPKHRVLAEWGEFPANLISLPTYFSGQGYHTMIAPSEAELGDPAPGFTRVFKEQIPCLARPAQEGGITSRQFVKWLDAMPEAPCFTWLQFFDTHPPQMPPEPFKSQYYSGNPADPQNAFGKEALSQVRGIEVVQEMITALPLLKTGIVEDALKSRLKDTVLHFQGKIPAGPDVAAHLLSLGPKAWGTSTLSEFTAWLAKQVTALDQDKVLPDLVPWMEKVLLMLREIEVDILSWLDGVVDYRFPVSQHKASVSYLDHLVGQVIAELKARDLYDSSTIVFTSPHGELFGERDVYFHHHLLLESVVRVPMIIKPGMDHKGKKMEFQPGKKVDGIFDSIDLFPTLLDALGYPIPRSLDGVSRWTEMVHRDSISEHDSISIDHHGLAHTIVSRQYKYMDVTGNHELSPRWRWKRGDQALFNLSTPAGEDLDVLKTNPEIAADLAARLQAWKKQFWTQGQLNFR